MGALGFSSRAIATALTFPAFIAPNKFPMVDTRVAKWVGENLNVQHMADPSAPILVRPSYLDSSATVLTLSDYCFVESWTAWCCYKADRLSEVTGYPWRPRDVEMAVFTAYGNDSLTLEADV